MIHVENVPQTATPTVADVKKEILEFCLNPQSKESILEFIQVELKPYNFKKYITRLFEDRYLQHTIPHNPRATTQQYITSKKGQAYLKSITI